MNKSTKIIVCLGLGMGALFGVSGSIFTDPPVLQNVLYEISSVALVVATLLLGLQLFKQDKDYLATGFLLFAIGEAIMTVGIPLGQVGGQASFGAGIAFYVPALLFISIPKEFPLWTRFTGLAACVPFIIAASKIFLGEQVLSTSALPGAGYGLLTFTIIGWILAILRTNRF